jgi:hypothetical protein
MFMGSVILTQPMTITVNNTGDGSDFLLGDGVCEVTSGAGDCTLRAAIEEANNNLGFHDIINFGISGGGVHTIMPGITAAIPPVVGLPVLSDNAGVTIDGYTQSGTAQPGTNPPSTATLEIEIKGQGFIPLAPLMHGIWIKSDHNIIRGLIINEFTGDGVRIEGTQDTSSNNLIYANFIGTDSQGIGDFGNAASSNTIQWWAGVSIIVPPCDDDPVYTMSNIVRRNLISGNGTNLGPPVNRGEGVSITNCPPGDNGFNTVDYNYIGTDITGIVGLGNDSDGVTIAEAAHDNLIDNNVISDNGYSGVGINGLQPDPPFGPRYTTKNTISNNIIGLDVNAISPLANGFQGVSIGRYGPNTWGFAPSNTVTMNTIAFNTMNGVLVDEHQADNTNCDFNSISQNSIYSNMQLGIDLVTPSAGPSGVVTFNDPGDIDSGPNQELNFPVINSAVIGGSNTTITGTVSVPSPATSIVEVFIAAPDPTGYGEGMTYIGSATPNGAGNWTLTTNATINTGDMITATTTDAGGNTSEFSANLTPVLPVELSSWEVSLEHSTVKLSWLTNAEVNNKGFSIMKSHDELQWIEIGWIKGHGTTSINHSYLYTDHNPFPGDNYYQLRQEDFSGYFDFSEVRHVVFDPGANDRVSVYPNPSVGIVEVHILNVNHDPASLRIYDILGRLHWSVDYLRGEMPESWKKSFELPEKQVYILQVRMGNMLINKKIVVAG